MVSITFLGTANAFGHQGRHTSCYLIQGSKNILVDAGYSMFSAIRSQFRIFPNLDAILISHLHPDHYMGLPQMVIEDKYVIKRTKKIPVYGPIGITKKIIKISEVMYREEVTNHIFNLFEFHEYGPDEYFNIPGGSVKTLPAVHSGNARMQIITIDNKTVGYTGDTSYVQENFDKLLKCDIIITEASSYEHKIPDHITFKEIEKLVISGLKRVYLSHLGQSVIDRADEVAPPLYLAYDGLKIDI
ncbi:MAG: MBL fold metallo-hydrolase [Candidatus Heimdallarchaeota archaeon]|nr:MBL fold metallo-hydrolase [Candidatus Heimdallarchaeota archaeon]